MAGGKQSGKRNRDSIRIFPLMPPKVSLLFDMPTRMISRLVPSDDVTRRYFYIVEFDIKGGAHTSFILNSRMT